MRYLKILIIIVLTGIIAFRLPGQDTTINNGYHKYFYLNGVLSSEGIIKDGKPEGYWKSYYEDGKLKSEGNRKNFELDSIWKFYNDEEKLVLEVTYRNGKKNGIRTSYSDKEIIKEIFINDIKENYTRHYYLDGKIKTEIPFKNGLEHGIGKEYAPDGTIITLIEYKKGFIVDRERINRIDKSGKKQGKWYFFYINGKIKTEGYYRDDKKNGYFKEFSEIGDLLNITKYIDDEIQTEPIEIQKLDVINEYFPNGQLKSTSLYRNGIPEGIKREFNENGTITKSLLYSNGIIIGEGIMLEDGTKNGPWKEYYAEGTLKAEGAFEQGKQIGIWKYYYRDGNLEQIGHYNKNGKPDGTWNWYYDSGPIRRKEEFRNGLRDGIQTEYDEVGTIIEEGEFIDDKEEGNWMEITGDCYILGSFRDGMRNGMWYTYYIIRNESKTDTILAFKGNYIDDNQDGKHNYYYENGTIMEEGSYIMGKKENDWVRYNSDGTIFMIITYKNGSEIRFEGIKIKPPFEENSQ